jgi:hypothetical protein
MAPLLPHPPKRQQRRRSHICGRCLLLACICRDIDVDTRIHRNFAIDARDRPFCFSKLAPLYWTVADNKLYLSGKELEPNAFDFKTYRARRSINISDELVTDTLGLELDPIRIHFHSFKKQRSRRVMLQQR